MAKTRKSKKKLAQSAAPETEPKKILVWSYQAIEALNYQTGFVWTTEAIAADLIRNGEAQDPRSGAFHLKHIDQSAPKKTKVQRAAKTSTPVIDQIES